MHPCIVAIQLLHAWVDLGRGVGLKSRDFGQPVQGSALSRLASMLYNIVFAHSTVTNNDHGS